MSDKPTQCILCKVRGECLECRGILPEFFVSLLF